MSLAQVDKSAIIKGSQMTFRLTKVITAFTADHLQKVNSVDFNWRRVRHACYHTGKKISFERRKYENNAVSHVQASQSCH